MRKKKSLTEVSALGQYIPMSIRKARRVIDQIRGRSYKETLMILELMPYRACYPIFKLIYSAAANAKHNKGFEKEDQNTRSYKYAMSIPGGGPISCFSTSPLRNTRLTILRNLFSSKKWIQN